MEAGVPPGASVEMQQILACIVGVLQSETVGPAAGAAGR
jgi:hypothetical protein